MVNYNKQLLANFVLYGIPVGFFIAMYFSVEKSWVYSAIIGAMAGLFLILFATYINVRTFSKASYPLDIQVNAPGNLSKSEFFLREFVSVTHFLGLAIYLVLSIGFFFSASSDTELLRSLLFITFISVYLILEVIRIMFTRITVDKSGINFGSVFYNQEVTWDEIYQIKRHGKAWHIICKSSKLNTNLILSMLSQYNGSDKIISLNEFSSDFLERELLKAIRYYGGNIKLTST
jgi:hypothetical protein